MEGTSGANIICLVHCNGQFVSSEDGQVQYISGRTISRTIKEGTTFEELRRVVSTVVGGDAGSSTRAHLEDVQEPKPGLMFVRVM